MTGCHGAVDPVPQPTPVAAPSPGSVTGLANRQVDELTGFTSPSGNIGCYLDATMARCDVADRSWAPPLRPASCEFAYGQGITVGRGRPAEFVCAGDTALGAGAELGYGDSITAGALRCESAGSGITCRDTATRHGFAISREAYHLF